MSGRGNFDELRLIHGGKSEVAADVAADLSGPYTKLVQAVFQDVLGRAPSETALQDWVAQLCAGSSASTFASCILHSQERREKRVSENYLKLLGRTPTAEGLEFWTHLLAAGKTEEEVLAAMISSSEYFTKKGSTNEGYIRGIYLDVLGRKATEAEVDSWVGLLNSDSATRLAVAYDFVSSEEYRLALINDWFWRYLRRQADSHGTRHWLEQMKHGMTQESAQTAILALREYFTSAITRS